MLWAKFTPRASGLPQKPRTVLSIRLRTEMPNSKNRWITLCLLVTIILAASDLIKLGSYDRPISPVLIPLRYTIILVVVGGLLLWKRSHYGRGLACSDLAWIALGVTMTIASCINADIGGIATGLWTIIVVPVVFSRILPCVLGQQGVSLLTAAMIGSGLSYWLCSFFSCPLEFPYRGVTGNPNQFGVLSAALTTALLGLLVARRHKKEPIKRAITAVTALLGIALVIASASRTSCLALSVVLLVALGVCLPELIRKPARLALTLTLCVITLYAVAPLLDDEATQAVAILALKFDNGSTLSGRDEIWSKTWRERSMFGHGGSYFETVGVGGSAHNTMIEMLGKYGIPAALAGIMAAVLSLHACVVHYWKNRKAEAHALTPLLIVTCFWILASAEAMLGPLGGALNVSFVIVTGLANALPRHAARLCVTKPHQLSLPRSILIGAETFKERGFYI